MNKTTGRYLTIAFFGMAVILLCEYLGLFEGLNNYLYDLSFRVRGPQQHTERIIIAAIDEKTLQRLGRWPVRRSYYADFLDKVGEAAVVGFDIIMAEPSEDDAILAKAIRQNGKVILPVYFDGNLKPVYPAGAFAPRAIGHIHVEPDIDGVVRKVFHTIREGDNVTSSFASVVYDTATNNKISRHEAPHETRTPLTKEQLLQADPMHINYSGPAGTFRMTSFADIVEGKYPAQFFKDKIILVGLTAIGLEDRILTPLSQQRNRMAGVEAHANILGNLVRDNAIKEVALWIRWLFSAAFSLLIFLVFMKLTEKRATLLWLFCLIFISLSVYVFFSVMNLWLTPALIYVTATFMYGTTYLFRLDEAARRLDREYAEVAAHLRWEKTGGIKITRDKGLMGFLSAGGINAKIRILTESVGQMIFEKKLIDAALLSNIHGIVLFNPDGKLIVENERAHTLFHSLTVRFDDLNDFYHIFSPYIVKLEAAGESKNTIPESGFNVNSTFVFSAPGNTYLKMDTSLIPLNGQQYLLCVFTDVTKIKELELLKGQIVSIVSHELKQPLTIIYGMGESLLQDLAGDERKYMEIINGEVLRMIQLVTRFLDISRLEAGRDHLKKERVDIVDLIHQIEPLFNTLANAKSIQIKINLPDKTPSAMLDRDLTKQCIMNLVENAITYSLPGNNVMIALTESASGWRIDIADNGIGIKEGELGKIFEKFYRGKAVPDNGSRGSGLGLAFVKEAVEAQGGTVSVRSVPGRGSTFSINLPIA